MGRLTITRIVVILVMAMATLLLVWRLAETRLQGPPLPAGPTTFYLVRGASIAAIMTALSAYLMLRYRRRFEDELRRRSEESQRMRLFFENIVQEAGEAIITLDERGVIRSWNRAAERIYGYTADEMVGRTSDVLVPPSLLAAGELRRLEETVESHGCVRHHDTQRLRKDGALITVRITRSILRDEHDKAIGSSAIVRDITSEREMEARLIRSEKHAAIGQAAACMAHEVRNALAGVWGTIEVLEGTSAWRALPTEVGKEVKLQLGRIAHIIDDLLTYARPATLCRERTDVHEVLDRAVGGVSRGPDGDGKRLRRRYAAGPLFADVDSAQLEQVFKNLATNAYQSMEPGGTLTVSTARTEAGLTIRFSDTGEGMSKETLSHAMEPFFTTKARGTGLGLAIVRGIVEAHKGTIDLASAPDRGTTVALTLPTQAGVDHPEPLDSPARRAAV